MKSLKRELSLFPVTTLVIGSVVGSGIFVSSSGMARSLGSAQLLLFVWVLGGVFTLFGAFTQCELVGQMPSSGGLYTYLREIYGNAVGFFFGWASFVISGSGAIAAIAFVFAGYLNEFVPLPHLDPVLEKWPLVIPYLGTLYPLDMIGVKIAGALLICGLTVVNIRGVFLGALLQSLSTMAKVLALIAIVVLAFVFGGSSTQASMSHFSGVTPFGAQLTGWALVGAITTALSGAFWSYDGWGNVAYIGDEVKDPHSTIPRGIVLGTISFVALYLLINLAYLYVLPIDQIASAPDDRVASTMASAVFGKVGATIIAAMILVSTFDSVNSSILTTARVYFTMAREKLFFKGAADVHHKYGTPDRALIYQCLWSLVLLFTGSFDLVTSMYVFVNWLIYALMGIGVFVLRKRSEEKHRPFKVPGYPWVPILFVLFSSLFVVLTLWSDVKAYMNHEQPVIKSLMGLVLVFSGLPFYIYMHMKKKID